MQFGLENVPGTFQRVMDVMLANVKPLFALVYLNDLFILLHTLDGHIDHARQELAFLYDAGDKLNLKQCKFLTNRIEYVGHFIRPGHPKLSLWPPDAFADSNTWLLSRNSDNF